MKSTDQYFDGIADKFASNIYGTTKGRLRHLLLLDILKPLLEKMPVSKVIDLGGGTGIMTREVAQMGHDVTLVDASADVLVLAQEYLAGVENVTFRKGTIQSETDLQRFDVVICHAVLEWLASPLETLSEICLNMRPGALLSLTFFNRDAALFGNAVYGNFDYIAKGMKVKNQVRLNPQNPLVPADVIRCVEEAGMEVKSLSGIRCFHDYMRERHLSDSQFEELVALERRYMNTEPFCRLGKYMHLLISKPA